MIPHGYRIGSAPAAEGIRIALLAVNEYLLHDVFILEAARDLEHVRGKTGRMGRIAVRHHAVVRIEARGGKAVEPIRKIGVDDEVHPVRRGACFELYGIRKCVARA